jgi:uncharacterized protein (DUF2237 family)
MINMILLSTLLQVTAQGAKQAPKNVLGTPLEACCMDPLGGFYRDGYCNTGYRDLGVHVVCAVMTKDFLEFTASCGNDLSTPVPQYHFPGLKEGDTWCLCVSRWKEAMEAGKAPPVILASCHEKSLEVVSLEDLKKYEFQP